MPPSRRALLSAAVLVPTTAAVVALTSGTAEAAEYTWGRTLKEGMHGKDVTQLQIRVAGYPGYRSVLSLDGSYGPKTKAAVKRFQSAYGLSADGVAGDKTFGKLNALQDSDNTPKHFTYAEFNKCNSTWGGGSVSASTAKFNALVTMWKLEALRHALGDKPITISSAFRSAKCNSAVGGVNGSRHTYGDAADLTGSHSFCKLAKQARNHGFRGILGPGFPNHYDHVHVSSGDHWDASDCGVV